MKRAARIFALMATLSVVPSVAGAQAEPTLEQRREAQMAYARAQALRAGAQYSEAATLFETADRLVPSVQALGNAIRSHKDCRTPEHDARAATLALRMQARYGADPRYAGFAEQVINELRGRLVRVNVVCDGCEVEADGVLQPATEFFLTPGDHRIVALWPGGRSREHRMTNARAGVTENVTLQPPMEFRANAGSTGVRDSMGSGDSSGTGSSGTGSSGTGSSGTGSSGTGSSGTGSNGTETGSSSGSGSSGTGVTGTSGTVSGNGTGLLGSGSGNGAGSGSGTGTGSGSDTGDPAADLVRPPPSPGGIHPAIFLTSLALTIGSGAVLTWSGIDTLNGVPAYESAARQGDRVLAERLLADGQGRELRTNILIGVTSGLGAVTIGTLIFTRWRSPQSEQAPTAMLVPTIGPLPSVALWGRF